MSAVTYNVAAPGKLNLCLFVGPPRADGLHELVSVFQPVSLADRVRVTFTQGDGVDHVECDGVDDGPNIVVRAIELCRSRGLLASVTAQVSIDKQVPVAAGMGGGSGDAAAFLRAVCALEQIAPEALADLAFELGADVPSQLTPVATVVRGAGELVKPLPQPLHPPAFFVIVPSESGLSTADVFAKADQIARWHDLGARGRQVDAAVESGSLMELLAISRNGLEPAILALRPELGATVESLCAHGAAWAGLTGSGPTAFGVFLDAGAAHAAAATLKAGHPGVCVAMPAEPQDWQVMAEANAGR